MSPILNWNGKLSVPKALLRGEDEARTESVRLTTEPSRTRAAVKQMSASCSKP